MNFEFDVLLQQMLTFYTMITVGFLGYKLKLFGDTAVSSLAGLVYNVFVPLMLFTDIVNSVELEMLAALPAFLFYTTVALAVMLVIGFISGRLFRLPPYTLGVHTAVVGFPNDGLVGYPLWFVIFPTHAALGMVGANIFYSVAQWVVAYPLVAYRGGRFKIFWKELLTPPLIASLLAIPLLMIGAQPAGNPIWDTLTEIGGCTKYTAMMYIGGMMAQKGFGRILGRPILFIMSAIKLLLGPVVVYLVLRPLGMLDGTFLAMVVMMAAMPSPMTICLQATMASTDEDYAVGSMVLTTFLCLFTIPVVMYLTTLL